MLARKRQIRVRLLQCLDGLLFALALLIAYNLRSSFPWWLLPELETLEKYLILAPLVIILGPLCLASQGFYDGGQLQRSSGGTMLGILRAMAFMILALVTILFITREQFARSVILLVGMLGGVFVFIRHEIFGWLEASYTGVEKLRSVWLGIPAEIETLRSAMSSSERESLSIVADMDPREASTNSLTALLHEKSINLVVVSLAGLDRERLQPFLQACEQEGIEVLLRPGLLTSSPYRLVSEVFAGEPVFYYQAQAADPRHLFIKQVMDYVLASLLLVLLSPLILLTIIAIWITSPGPALYRQTRAGLNGMPFTMYKFRSMRLGAEAQKEQLSEFNEMKGPVFKLSNDPRVTPLGRFLRGHSIDEIPQLWNVLRGEMSIVGPRPLPVEEVGRFASNAYRRRLSIKPGLTCLWQISGRNDISDFEDWVRLDLAYIDRWSLWLDIKILIATLPVALFARGGR
jgi:exopolysaccharide biosynthesis polyprenyl glycosylphosphotransferase